MIFDTGIEENLIRATMGMDESDIKLASRKITENGLYIAANDGCDGYDKVDVNVLPKLQQKEITENGTYSPDEGYDGFSDVIVDVQSGLLDAILKLPTYASYKLGEFEYLFKVGSALGKKRNIYCSVHNNAYYLSEYSRFDSTYVVICEKNKPVMAYEYNEWNIGSEYYDYKGKLSRTEVYSGNTVVKNKMDSENWWLTFERKRTSQSNDGSEPQEYVSNINYSVFTKPFVNYRTVYTTLTEAGFKDFSLRLWTALKSLP